MRVQRSTPVPIQQKLEADYENPPNDTSAIGLSLQWLCGEVPCVA